MDGLYDGGINPRTQGQITSSRLQRIGSINDAKRYLEIGVHKGETFGSVDFEAAVAVDPHFQFDTHSDQRAGVRYICSTSDEFFAVSQGDTFFDLIFLDGLHTFEQCFRDFCSTLSMATSRTVWLIDDTVPCDAFSIRKCASETFHLRKIHGLTNQAWHGDVFKVLFAIHDFFPTLDYRTIVGSGNPQTVLVKSARVDFQPRWNSLAEIENLDFFDFEKNRSLINPLSEEEAILWLSEKMGSR